MKKIYLTAALLSLGNLAFSQNFFVPTTYRGAFAPAPEAQWTDGWTEWDPQNAAYPSSTVTITNSITTNTTWTASNTYLLSGQIYVKNGATLTIEPGTHILGDKSVAGAGLFITQGSKLVAEGTANNPIVFTSNQPAGSRGLGDWGGVILMGQASYNGTSATAGYGIGNIEGLVVGADTQFGGGSNPNDNDNSGSLKYVRIEFGGYVYQPNKEINGLTLGAIGRGTTIDHVQVSFTNDDGFEWFGGTVNCRHLVSYRNLDDDFDTDNGFSGNVQFGLIVRDPSIADNPSVSTSEGFESDNDATGSTAAPQTAGIFSNVTAVGPFRGNTGSTIASGFRRGARLRRNTGLKIYNSIFMDFPRGIYIDGTVAITETNAQNGTLKYKNNIVAGYTTAYATEKLAASSFNITSWFGSNANDSIASTAGILVDPYNYLTGDYRPVASTSPALTNVSFVDGTLAAQTITAPTATPSYTYCVGAAATTLSATASSNCTLVWYDVATGGTAISQPTPSTTVAGTSVYYVAQTNADGYEGPRTAITVTVNATPTTPTIQANGPTSFCNGGSVVLTSSEATGNTWSTTATSASITVSNSGSYSVTYVDANGCSATSTPVSVNVSSAPIPTINASATQACSGETVTLTASTSDSYLWSTGETTQTITLSASDVVTVTTTNADACNGVGTSDQVTVTFGTTPTASGSFTTSGNIATFSNTSTDATTYSWDFGDQSSSSASAPTHAYAANGSYTVTLTAINGNCTDVTTFTVVISASLEELSGLTSVNIYPNPAAEETVLSFESSVNQNATLVLTNQIGQVVTETAVELTNGGNTFKLATSDLANGMYFVHLNTENGAITRKLVVKK